MRGIGVGVAKDCDRLDPQLAARADDPDGDLAAVGDRGCAGTGAARRVATVFAQRHVALRVGGRRHSGMLPCFLRRVRVALAGEHPQRRDDPRPRLGWLDHVVDVAPRRGDIGIGEALLVLGDEPRALGGRVGGLGQLVAEDDVDRALGAHHRDPAVGQARFTSPRMCLLLMTSYAPPYALRVMTVTLGTVASQ